MRNSPTARVVSIIVCSLQMTCLAMGEAASTLELAGPGEPGIRLTVTGVVRGRNGQPIAGAEIHAYQTDVRGWYTAKKPMDEPHARLSGRLRTDAEGRFELRSIRPGRYPWTARLHGRERKIPAHIHLDITAPGHAERRFQLVFADDPLLAEPYWKDWIKRHGQPVLEPHASGQGIAGSVIIVLE
jgi:protocatechuate 3,4-dioxygenase beta subunit